MFLKLLKGFIFYLPYSFSTDFVFFTDGTENNGEQPQAMFLG